MNDSKEIEKIKEYLKENDFEVNKSGVYTYESTNGFSKINLPYVILEVSRELNLIKNNNN